MTVYILHIYRAAVHPCTVHGKEVYDSVHIYRAAVHPCTVHSKRVYDCVHIYFPISPAFQVDVLKYK